MASCVFKKLKPKINHPAQIQIHKGSCMDTLTLVGLAAATFTTVSLFPQVLKSWRTRWKPTKDGTVAMFSLLFCVGVFMWLVYGVSLGDLPMMAANSLSLLQAIIILAMQVRRLKLKK
jgi:MtN3 and saliva related transmembrane protein